MRSTLTWDGNLLLRHETICLIFPFLLAYNNIFLLLCSVSLYKMLSTCNTIMNQF